MNMSYCAVENTNNGLGQVRQMMQEFDTISEWVESRNEYEQRAWSSLVENMKEILSWIEEEDEDF